MHTVVLICLLSLAYVELNDVMHGPIPKNSNKFFDEYCDAKAAPWFRIDYVRIKAPPGTVIAALFVIDQSHNKSGIATVEKGGVGEREAILYLRSSSANRGFRFRIQVYSTPSTMGREGSFSHNGY